MDYEMILKNLLTNTYYISPEIIILFGIFVATLTGVFIKKNSVGTTCNLVILTFIISVYQILSIGQGQHLLFNNSVIISEFTQFSKVVILLCNCVILIMFHYFGYKSTNKSDYAFIFLQVYLTVLWGQ
jgi:NADH:ubiquinone oxidoreductase subunit 2 (subunit N)